MGEAECFCFEQMLLYKKDFNLLYNQTFFEQFYLKDFGLQCININEMLESQMLMPLY